jgi:hypothetical protein
MRMQNLSPLLIEPKDKKEEKIYCIKNSTKPGIFEEAWIGILTGFVCLSGFPRLQC